MKIKKKKIHRKKEKKEKTDRNEKEINKPGQNCSMTWADKRETRLANTSSKNKRGTACCRIYTRASNFLIAFPSDIFMVDYSSRGYSHRASGHDQSLPTHPRNHFTQPTPLCMCTQAVCTRGCAPVLTGTLRN